MAIRHVIFDWDGTLVDSASGIVACIQAAAADLQLPEKTSEEIKYVIGLGLSEMLNDLYPQLEPLGLAKLVDRYRYHFFAGDQIHASLFDGARDVLEQLDKQGYYLAVATGKSRQGLNLAIEQLELEGLFIATRCAEETCSKPSPDMLLELIEFAALDASAVLMIGDTTYDIDMAKNANVMSIGVSCGSHEDSELLEHGALACLSDINELPAWLEQNK